jgi:hypothetical protein
MSWFTRSVPWVLAAALVALSGSSHAAPDSSVEQARAYFQMGAKAYDGGKYLVAVQAFEQAYKLAQRKGLIFSIGQAYRKLYLQTKRPEYLKAALDKYRLYVEQAPSGSRRADADEAINELEREAANVATPTGEDGEPVAPPPLPPLEQKTHISVSTVPAGATVTIDGKPLGEDDFMEVEPGKHRVVAKAPGYFDEVQEVAVPKGSALPVPLKLRAKPAMVTLEVDEGAEVYLDGRPMGLTPLREPLEMPAGNHFIAVSMNGRDAYTEELDLDRGQQLAIDAELDVTAQRITSYVFFGTSIALAGAAAVFTGLAMYEQSNAKDIKEQSESATITSGQLTDYNDSLERRDRIRAVAGVGWGAAAVAGGIGLFLFAFDEPKLEAPPKPKTSDEEEAGEEPPEAAPTMEIGAAPYLLPGAAGATIVGRF